VSDSPQADRERAFIRALIAQGKTKKQIEDALVAQYGRGVLATPPDSGFDLAVWIVPGLAVLLAGTAIAFAVVRWRRNRPRTGALATTPAGGPSSDDGGAARLRSDLDLYDL
jgi:cytochrome c-type biogenesis protein CcmH